MDTPLLAPKDAKATTLWAQLGSVSSLAWPLAGSELLFYFNILLQVGFVGRLGAQEQSAWFLARGWYCLTGLALVIGMSGALETFVGQAWGAGEKRLLGILLQRGMLLTTLVGLLCCPSQLWASALLQLMGQDARVAAAAGRYCVQYIPAMLMAGVADCQKRYLVAQGYGRPVLITSVISTACCPLVLWVVMEQWRMGLAGIALATLVYHLLLSACMTTVMMAVDWDKLPASRSWQGWSRLCFRDWQGYMHIALPSTALLSLDWGIGEITMFLAGLLPNANLALAVFGISNDTASMAQMSGYAIGAAAATVVANHLGAANGAAARTAALAAVLVSLLVSVVLFGLLMGIRSWWIARLTTDPSVAHSACVVMLPALMAFVGKEDGQPADGALTQRCTVFGAYAVGRVFSGSHRSNIFVTLSGVLRGAGRQREAAVSYLLCSYLVGLPIAMLAAFRLQGGVEGLWWAQVTTSVLLCMMMSVQIVRMDWATEERNAAQRLFRCRTASFKEDEDAAPSEASVDDHNDNACSDISNAC